MEEVKDTAAVSTTTESAAPAASAASVAPTPTDSASPAEDGAMAEVPAYTPDFKFKAYGEEGEIEENFRQYIKDKQSEESFKKLYSKAHAFEKTRERFDKVRSEFQNASTEVESYKTGLNELRAHVKNKDFEAFFKKLNVPMSTVWEWVNDRVNYQDLSPEQKMHYDEAMRLRRENFELQNQNRSTGDSHSQTMTRLANMELDLALSRPDVSGAQEAFDAKHGKGAFRDFVIDRGDIIERRTGRDSSPEEAIKDALKWLDFGPNQGTTSPNQPLVAQSSNKPVIPNLKGGGAAPVKKKPQSLKELREQIALRQSASS